MMKFPEPDYSFWDRLYEFPEWQVVCLWVNIEPSRDASQSAKSQVIQKRMSEAREHDRLHSVVLRTDYANATPRYEIMYQRSDLIAYAKLEREKPAFLFAEKRSHAQKQSTLPENSVRTESESQMPAQAHEGTSSTDQIVVAQSSPFLTVKQFAAKHPAYTEGALRNLLYRSEPTRSSRGIIPGNGMDIAVVRQGRKVLIDEGRFFDWLREGKS
jgi:hypothetical protein